MIVYTYQENWSSLKQPLFYFSSEHEDLVETQTSIAAQMITVEQQRRQEQHVRELQQRYVSVLFQSFVFGLYHYTNLMYISGFRLVMAIFCSISLSFSTT